MGAYQSFAAKQAMVLAGIWCQWSYFLLSQMAARPRNLSFLDSGFLNWLVARKTRLLADYIQTPESFFDCLLDYYFSRAEHPYLVSLSF
tara:strand:- start:62 stop:328 length:267 start_codon:yes stop_codon:yes gene_type:complete